MKVLILSSDYGDWEALYIDGKKIVEWRDSNDLGRLFWLIMAEEYGFKSSDIKVYELSDDDENYLNKNIEKGNCLWPEYLSEFNGRYE